MRATTGSYAGVANYRLQGPEHGPGALVLLHGLGGDLDQLWSITDGRARGQPRRRTGRRRPGTRPGRSGPARPTLDFGVLAGDVVALADHLRESSAPALVLVGVSMGAATALTLAISEEPARAYALVLVRPARAQPGGPEEPRRLRRGRGAVACPVTGGRALFQESVLYQEVKALSPSTAASLLAQFEKPSALERVRRLEDLPSSGPLPRRPGPAGHLGTDAGRRCARRPCPIRRRRRGTGEPHPRAAA